MPIDIPYTEIDSETVRRVRGALSSAAIVGIPGGEITALRVAYRGTSARSHTAEVAAEQNKKNLATPLKYTLTLNGSANSDGLTGIDTGVDETTAILLQRLLAT